MQEPGLDNLPFSLDQLRILRAIAREGSFKRAADSLYVSQPAVSLQVQNLEKQLNVCLFDRCGRSAQLTEPGRVLLSYCDRILSQCHEACRALEDLNSLRGGHLRVGGSQTTGTYLMPRMLGLFRHKHPDVVVQLHVHSTRRTSWSVVNGQIDLAIIGGEIPVELSQQLLWPALCQRRVAVGAAAGASHGAAGGIAEGGSLPLGVYRPGCPGHNPQSGGSTAQ